MARHGPVAGESDGEPSVFTRVPDESEISPYPHAGPRRTAVYGSKASAIQSRFEEIGSSGWGATSALQGRGECELCQSETATSQEYGLRVCPACDEIYLP